MIEKLIADIKQSLTPFHTIEAVSAQLVKNGFVPLSEKSDWDLKKDGKYFVTRAGSSLVAFSLSNGCPSFNIVAPHTDSACFKLKGKPDTSVAGLHKINCEVYGSPIFSTWQDRRLTIAGRAFYKDKKSCELVQKLVKSNFNVVIPNLPIHLNREVNNGYKFNPQKDMIPIAGLEKGDILKEVVGEDAISSDLYVVCDESGYTFGKDNALLASPRLDDLQGVFGGLYAFLD
ncbi:MAG: M18 family aminopeptidase, partial [Firmicutes bacterium]|nr:M18 family aminopeptidase [Bacillota bacterium]